MIPVRRPEETAALPPRARTALARRQQTANAFLAGDIRINKAWANFLSSVPKKAVAEALARCFRFKCAYCEGVAAQDIEHFQPKTAYPGRMFAWSNFLRGCKNCNDFKLDRFPLQDGQPLLLDPCEDDPLDYFVWDYQTGSIGARPEPGYETRARTTRDLLRLDQEPLREERRRKLALVLFLLARVVAEEPVSLETQRCLKEELDGSRPWLGIVRQVLRRPGEKYGPLVEAARSKLPEFDEWVAPWL